MHAQATQPQPAAETAPPLPAVTTCPHCGQLPGETPHREDCFPNFQVALLAAYPALQDAVSLREAEAIERIFRLYTDFIRMLRPRFAASADTCVERCWWEATSYVERLLARHARRHPATDAAAAAS